MQTKMRLGIVPLKLRPRKFTGKLYSKQNMPEIWLPLPDRHSHREEMASVAYRINALLAMNVLEILIILLRSTVAKENSTCICRSSCVGENNASNCVSLGECCDSSDKNCKRSTVIAGSVISVIIV